MSDLEQCREAVSRLRAAIREADGQLRSVAELAEDEDTPDRVDDVRAILRDALRGERRGVPVVLTGEAAERAEGILARRAAPARKDQDG